MGGIFNIDGKVYQLLDKLADCLIVSLLWLLSSLPIFTIGAATTALYYSVNQIICQNKGTLWKTFWTAFKENFKQATILWIIFLLILAFLLLDMYISFIMSGLVSTLKWILLLLFLLILFVIMWAHYWFSYISHISDPIKVVLKNTLIMCILHLPKSLSLLALFTVCAIVLASSSRLAFLIVILPGFYMIAAHHLLERVFSQYWNTKGASEE